MKTSASTLDEFYHRAATIEGSVRRPADGGENEAQVWNVSRRRLAKRHWWVSIWRSRGISRKSGFILQAWWRNLRPMKAAMSQAIERIEREFHRRAFGEELARVNAMFPSNRRAYLSRVRRRAASVRQRTQDVTR
jgi:hypothetical protein